MINFLKENKIVAVAICLVMMCTSSAYATTTLNSSNNGYSDIETSNWAFSSVMDMSQKGIVNGYPDGTFKPSNTVTYAEFIKMAYIAHTKDEVVSAGKEWASTYYEKALKAGLFTSKQVNENKLNQEIPREDMALIVSNILGKVEIKNFSKLEKSLLDITYESKNEYDIIKAYSEGIITGYEDNTFKPENTLTRAEGATVIYRLINEDKRICPNLDVSEDTKIEKIHLTRHNKNSTWENTVPLKTGKLGEYGIEKFVITAQGYVAMYSSIAYADVDLVIDGKMVTGFCNPNGGEYWEEDGYYVYYSEPIIDNLNVKGKKVSVYIKPSFNEKENFVLKITNFTL